MSRNIALIFDFDDTLAPDSTSAFIESLGVEVGDFWNKANKLISDEGWDPMPVYLYQMLELMNQGENSHLINKEKLSDFGKTINFYDGVEEFFPRMKNFVKECNDEVNLEFYIISSGIGEILRSSTIAKYFSGIWACDYHYAEDGRIKFPKNVVSFTEKTRFLFHISKGFIDSSRTDPYQVNEKIQDGDYTIPFNQMLYLGDGLTDVPCFKLIKRYGGVPLAVMHTNKKYKWEQAWGLMEDQRVATLVPADYREGSTLDSQVKMFLKQIVDNIQL